MVNVKALPFQFDEATWEQLLPRLRAAFPRLTPDDLADAQRRVDLLSAKVQNRHWIDRMSALRQIHAVVSAA